MEQDNDNEDGSVSTFQSLAAEGDILAKMGDYRKAIEAYTKALTIKSTDKNVLVARSRCHLALGDNQSALDDAGLALKEDNDFFKAKFQKAEALYAKGDFEMALVYYHRGHDLRPELEEFRLGIQKAREAIDNSIGNPKDYKPKAGSPPIEVKFLTSPSSPEARVGSSGEKKHGAAAAVSVEAEVPPIPHNENTIRQLLGELYVDKEYLEKFYNDPDFVDHQNNDIKQAVIDGLKYLDGRIAFWSQQKPIYARKKETGRSKVKGELSTNKSSEARKQMAATKTESNKKEVPKKKELEFISIEEAQSWFDEQSAALSSVQERGLKDKVLRYAKSFLAILINKKSQNQQFLDQIPQKTKKIAELYGVIGNEYRDVGRNLEAESSLKKQLLIAKQNQFPDEESNALGSLGRIYVKARKYSEAIKVWQEAIPIVEARQQNNIQSFIELAWLNHDIAKCYLELNTLDADAETPEKQEKLTKAQNFAIKSILYAEKGVNCTRPEGFQYSSTTHLAESVVDSREPLRWLLQGLILNGTVDERLTALSEQDKDAAKQNIKKIKEYYSKALEVAHDLNDKPAMKSIRKAMETLRQKV